MSKWSSEGAEGFICPYCLVSFNSSNKLQAHFIDFHSGEGNDAAVILELEASMEQQEADVIQDQLGHNWKPVALAKPCSCQACDVIIWSSSYTCQTCQMVIHPEQKCLDQVTKVCTPDSSESAPDAQHTLPRADAPPPAKGISDIVKRQIAKGRNRYTDDGFDLDLSYITERIIAMSFPGSGVESAYRNNLKDVAKMLKTRHQDNYMIFNLSERSYDVSKFNNQVLDFGWPDHLAPSLERLSIVCKSMKSWLDSDPQHVVVVHCKGGKGRTGCVIASFMNYSKICQSASAALDHFAMKRFYDDKLQGVTQPSQRRYVHYFEDLLVGKIKLDMPPIKLSYVIMHGIPNFDNKGGCRPFIKIYQNMQLIHTSGLYVCTSDKDRVKISLYGGLKLEGEILIKCFHKRTHTGVDSIFRCQFHHAVISDHRQVWTKQDLDDAFKDKRFSDDIKVELIFEPTVVKRNNLHRDHLNQTDIRHSLLADRRTESVLEGFLTEDDEKRNSYAAFEGGYDNGGPQGHDLIQFTDPNERDRSSTSDSYKMDPSLIERVVTDDGEIYTVVNKSGNNSRSNSRDPSPERTKPRPAALPTETSLTSSYGSPRYSHLVHNREVGVALSRKPDRPPPPAGYSVINHNRPTTKTTPTSDPPTRYEDVNERKLVLTPVSPRDSDGGEMWMSVKWQPLSRERKESDLSSSHRSSSQTAIDNLLVQEEYTNLTEMAKEGGVFVAQQRRHSFSEGESTISLTVPRESIIPISVPSQGAVVGPASRDIYATPTNELECSEESTYTVPPDAIYGNVNYPNEEDYVNYDAEDYSHDYLNEDELREQLRNNPVLPHSEGIVPATVKQEKMPATGIKDFLMENLRIKKPTMKTVIQSSAVSAEERKQSMPMFSLDNSRRGLQVGRGDYMDFSVDSWGGGAKMESSAAQSKRPPDRPSPPSARPPVAKKPISPPPRPHPPHHAKDESSPKAVRKVPKEAPPPKPPLPAGLKPHRPLQGIKSQPSIEHSQETNMKVPSVSTGALGHNSPGKLVVRSQPGSIEEANTKSPLSSPGKAPPKPAPYQPDRGKSPPTHAVTQVKELMSHWYRPDITREEACSLVKRMEAGSFIVRDSQTVSGGYAITIKVSEELLRQRKKLADDIEVTDDMCVTHFLIQPDPEGVKLQGWNEPAFKTLPDFIAKHTTDKLCLPCVLKLPRGLSDAYRGPKKKNEGQQHLSAAACDLVLLGNIEVLHPHGDSVITEAARQLKSLDLPTSTIVNFKASMNGVTITDKANGLLSKRNYAISSITHCGLDPADTRWNLSHLGDSVPIRNKPCFGIIHKMDSSGYMCLLFAEIDTHQPISNVVAYVKRLINLSKS